MVEAWPDRIARIRSSLEASVASTAGSTSMFQSCCDGYLRLGSNFGLLVDGAASLPLSYGGWTIIDGPKGR